MQEVEKSALKFGIIDYYFYLCEIKAKVMEEKSLDYAHVVNSVLQITPDIEEEMAEVERGETVSMSEFKTMFAKWLD